MTTQITITARRIARVHNQHSPQTHGGGFLGFNADGTGGAWYSAGSRPDVEITFPIHWARVTAREVQEWLDNVYGGE